MQTYINKSLFKSVMGHIIEEDLHAKYRPCELNAIQNFVDAIKFFQDDAWSRTADLTPVNIIKADLFYHKNLMPNIHGSMNV